MTPHNGPRSTMALRVTNSSSETKTLNLEPWGEQYRLGPNESIDLRADGPAGGRLEMETLDRDVTVWGWSGSTVRVSRDGKEVESGAAKLPCPDTPPKRG